MPRSRLMACIAGCVANVFGALTIFSGGRTLLGLADMGQSCPSFRGLTRWQGPPIYWRALAFGRGDGRASCRLRSSLQPF